MDMQLTEKHATGNVHFIRLPKEKHKKEQLQLLDGRNKIEKSEWMKKYLAIKEALTLSSYILLSEEGELKNKLLLRSIYL